jgi:hypothetical protein
LKFGKANEITYIAPTQKDLNSVGMDPWYSILVTEVFYYIVKGISKYK